MSNYYVFIKCSEEKLASCFSCLSLEVFMKVGNYEHFFFLIPSGKISSNLDSFGFMCSGFELQRSGGKKEIWFVVLTQQ